MPHRPLLKAGLLAAFCLVSLAAFADEPQAGAQKPARLEREIVVRLDYLLYLPRDYDQQAKWPLVLFLHGAGERGADLELVKTHGPPKLVAQGKSFPFILVSPQCPAERRWEPIELTALLDEVCEKYHVDTDRIYVTGLSMGGAGTWSLAIHTPERFAAIAPVCGPSEPRRAKAIARLPAWVFHGTLDKAVLLSESEEMVEALKAAGAEPKFTVYPDVGHDSWNPAYADPELYQWLLSHKRAQAEN